MSSDFNFSEEIESLSEEGNILAEEGKFDLALEKFLSALELVPDPKRNYEATTWLLTSIGDMYFLKVDHKKASNYFYDALNSVGGVENPFINLRLGQCLYELNMSEQSKEYLLRAYMLEGTEVFNDEDSKYFESIEDII